MTFRRLFAFALGAMLLLPLTTGIVHAQDPAPDEEKALYPNTTREEPELDLRSQEVSDRLNKGLNAVNEGNYATAKEILEPMAKSGEVDSKYAQALALQGLASLAYQKDKLDQAINYLKQSLANGVLPNDTYFQLMFRLAEFYLIDEQYQKALETLQAWRTEGGNQTAESFGLEGRVQYRMENYEAAIASLEKAKSMTEEDKAVWNQVLGASFAETGQSEKAMALAEKQLQANPGDETTQRNTVSLLINSQKYAQAIDIMEKAQAKGLLTESRDYVNLAKLHMMLAQSSDAPKPEATKAVAVLEQAVVEGKIDNNAEVQMLLGDAAYMAMEEGKAIAAYKKAAELGAGGNADMRRARLLFNQGRYGEARNAAEAAIEHGADNKGSAYMLIASAERSLDNKSAATAAMKKAAQYPETRERAERWLREAGN